MRSVVTASHFRTGIDFDEKNFCARKAFMPEHGHRNSEDDAPNGNAAPVERTFVHRVLRYVPNLLRDEWINIGVLLYDPETGERSLRLIEDTTEFNRVRRLHPRFDESALRGLRDHLESRFGSAIKTNGDGGPIHSTLRNGQGNPMPHSTEWLQVLEKWDATLSQSLQLAEPKATIADDLEEEIDRLYDERVAVPRIKALRLGRPTTRAQMRKYCKQVLKQARIWDRIERRIPASDFTYEGDPMRIDYGYWRNNNRMRGFMQTIPVNRGLLDAKAYADTARHIVDRVQTRFDSEFTAITDVPLDTAKPIHKAIKGAFNELEITPIPLENFAVWVAKLRPMLQ
jgi:Tfp pilus assembly protein PilN